jgi:hypothetical protein
MIMNMEENKVSNFVKDEEDDLPLEPPKLVRENYDHLPWTHKTFESWKEYVLNNARSDGLVYPRNFDSYSNYRGYGINDWFQFKNFESDRNEVSKLISNKNDVIISNKKEKIE